MAAVYSKRVLQAFYGHTLILSALLTDMLRLVVELDRISCSANVYAHRPRGLPRNRSAEQVLKMHQGMRARHKGRCPQLPELD